MKLKEDSSLSRFIVCNVCACLAARARELFNNSNGNTCTHKWEASTRIQDEAYNMKIENGMCVIELYALRQRLGSIMAGSVWFVIYFHCSLPIPAFIICVSPFFRFLLCLFSRSLLVRLGWLRSLENYHNSLAQRINIGRFFFFFHFYLHSLPWPRVSNQFRDFEQILW